MLDHQRIAEAPVTHEPFSFFTASSVLPEEHLNSVRADFPDIKDPGIFPLSALTYGPAFDRLIQDISAQPLADLLSEKFDVDLAGLPVMVTVRGHAQKKDGRIHTDSKDKVVTCLLYLNDKWDESGGRLRLLRSGNDLDDYLVEIPPNGGTLAAFKVADNSWHGHEPFVGQRRYVMFNWVRSDAALSRNIGRHKFSARLKQLNPFH